MENICWIREMANWYKTPKKLAQEISWRSILRSWLICPRRWPCLLQTRDRESTEPAFYHLLIRIAFLSLVQVAVTKRPGTRPPAPRRKLTGREGSHWAEDIWSSLRSPDDFDLVDYFNITWLMYFSSNIMIDIWLKQERIGIHVRFKKQDSEVCKYRKAWATWKST